MSHVAVVFIVLVVLIVVVDVVVVVAAVVIVNRFLSCNYRPIRRRCRERQRCNGMNHRHVARDFA